MKTVIVFESMFGNTEKVAAAVAEGMRGSGTEVTVVGAGTAVLDEALDCDLLVLAAPTHALTLSSPASRADAVARGAAPEHAGSGIREWLAHLDERRDGSAPRIAAVFDTKVTQARHWPGSAARREARTLKKHGFDVVDSKSFYVTDMKGPLADGELERARVWGGTLSDRVTSTSP